MMRIRSDHRELKKYMDEKEQQKQNSLHNQVQKG